MTVNVYKKLDCVPNGTPIQFIHRGLTFTAFLDNNEDTFSRLRVSLIINGQVRSRRHSYELVTDYLGERMIAALMKYLDDITEVLAEECIADFIATEKDFYSCLDDGDSI